VCGEDVPDAAKSCPACGADERTGLYGEGRTYDDLDLPEDSEEFNYQDFVKREFGSSAKPAGLRTLWWVVAIVLLVLMVLGALRALGN
jgi:hypothetical protein